jgi:hypothetical protein
MSVRSFRRLDEKHGRIEFVDIAKAEPSSLPADRTTLLRRCDCRLIWRVEAMLTLPSSFHAQERGGAIVDGAPAFAAMWRVLPARPLRLLGDAMQSNRAFMRFMDVTYNVFLRFRPQLQRLARKVLR